MKMRINHKILSIPPHISTSWEHIISLKTEKISEGFLLHIVLKSGSVVTVPGLDVSIIDAIFLAHSKHMETSSSVPLALALPHPNTDLIKLFETSSPLSFAEFRGLTSALQHDPELTKAPDFPKEISDKISLISASLGIKDPRILPREEPHCNCPHCQIVRFMKQPIQQNFGNPLTEENLEEEVSDEDLSFKSWIIYPEKEKIYKVIHPDDQTENYLVDLGSPVSCTCGVKHCEHIKAVLNT